MMKTTWFSLTLLFGMAGLFSALPPDSGWSGKRRSVSTMCPVALRIDCANDYVQQTDETLCATNGVTYVNLCFFSKDKCAEPQLNILHFGACPSAAQPTAATTPSPSQPSSTSAATTPAAPATTTVKMETTTLDEYEILRRVFCAPESQVNCALFQQVPYCGSNYIVYNNECEFVRAQCTQDIETKDITYCTSVADDAHGHHGHEHQPHHRR